MENIKGNICLVEVGKVIYLIHKPKDVNKNSKNILKSSNTNEVCNFN